MCVYTLSRKNTHTNTHAHARMHTHTHTHSLSHTHTYTHTLFHTNTYIHKRRRTHSLSHKHTHTHAHTRTHTLCGDFSLRSLIHQTHKSGDVFGSWRACTKLAHGSTEDDNINIVVMFVCYLMIDQTSCCHCVCWQWKSGKCEPVLCVWVFGEFRPTA